MPSLSPTMSEGKIVKWLKEEGDEINPGDVLCDIETDKAVVSMETEEEGVLAKILVPDNTKDIKVGSLIALMVEKGQDWKSVEEPSKYQSPAEGASNAPEKDDKGAEETFEGPPVIEVTMPSLSPTMSEGKIVKWLKKEGDHVNPGDVLCDIETDKAVVSMETEEEGTLAKILIPEETKDIKIGTLIALIAPEGTDWTSVVVPKETKPIAAESSSLPPAPSSTSTPDTSHVPSSSPGVPFGPAVRSLLVMYNLEPNQIKSSGKKNRILKEDVLKHISDNKVQKIVPKAAPPPKQKPVASSSSQAPPIIPTATSGKGAKKYIDIELSNVRKVIAKRLSQSKQEIPHSYGTIQCSIDRLLELRKKLRKDNVKVSVNDFVIKAVATALQQCPEINTIYQNGQAIPLKNIDISIAVATDSGLITPIVKAANEKGIVDIANSVRDLAERARSGKLKPEEFQGGSFTISNLGMFGVTEFTAIINPPQCAILAVGGGIENLRSDLRVHTDMRVSLSYDRRAIEEDEAAAFLQVLRTLLEDPSRILVGNVKNELKSGMIL